MGKYGILLLSGLIVLLAACGGDKGAFTYDGANGTEIFYGSSVDISLTSPELALTDCLVSGGSETFTALGLTIDRNTCRITGTASQLLLPTAFTIWAIDRDKVEYDTTVTLSVIPKPTRYVYRANATADKITIGAVRPGNGQIIEAGEQLTGDGTSPSAVAVDRTARFLFVANRGNDTLAVYQINAANGGLTLASTLATNAEPMALALAPSGRFLFGLHANTSEISAQTIHPSTGALTQVNTISVTGIPKNLVVHPNGRYLYAITSSAISSYDIDQTTGAISANASAISFSGGDLAIHPSERWLYVTSGVANTGRRYDIDSSDGTLSNAATFTNTDALAYSAFVMDPTGKFAYGVGDVNNQVDAYSVSTVNGDLTALGTVTVAGCAPATVGVDRAGNYLYLPCATGETRALSIAAAGTLTENSTPESTGFPTRAMAIVDISSRFILSGATDRLLSFGIDAGNGELLAITSINDGVAGTQEVAVHPSGRYAFLINSGSHTLVTYSINPATGALAVVGTRTIGSALTGLAVHPSGRNLYVVSSGNLKVYPFSFDAETAELTLLPESDTGAGPKSITVHPNGRYAYLANSDENTISMFNVDDVSGELVPFTAPASAPTPADANKLAIDPTGRFLFVTYPFGNSVGSYVIEAAGNLTQTTQAEFALVATVAGLAVDPTGRQVYASDTSNHQVHWLSIDRSQGATDPGELNSLDAKTVSNTPRAIAVDTAGRYLYSAIGGTSSKLTRHALNHASDIFGANSSLTTTGTPVCLAVSP